MKALFALLILAIGALVTFLEIQVVSAALNYADASTRLATERRQAYASAAYFALIAVAPYLRSKRARWYLLAVSVSVLIVGSGSLGNGDAVILQILVGLVSASVWYPLLKRDRRQS